MTVHHYHVLVMTWLDQFRVDSGCGGMNQFLCAVLCWLECCSAHCKNQTVESVSICPGVCVCPPAQILNLFQSEADLQQAVGD